MADNTTNEQGGGVGGGLTEDRVKALVAEALKPVTDSLGQLTSSLQQRQEQGAAAGVRDRFIQEKLADLPEVYRERLPKIDDLNKLLQAEQDVRALFRADRAKLGVPEAPDVGGGNVGGAPVSALVSDPRSPSELVEEGLRRNGAGGGRAAPRATLAERAAAAQGGGGNQ